MRMITYSVGGRRYSILGANADLWDIAIQHPQLFEHSDLDTLAQALASSDDNERMAASKTLIENKWRAHPVLGPYPFLECLSEFEFERKFYNKYRDHVCHQLKVYLLGLGVLGCSEYLRDGVATLLGTESLDITWLVTAVFHDIGYVVENEHSQPGTQTWQRVQDAYRSAMRSPLAALIRDSGLSEATEQVIQKTHSIRTPTLDGMGDLEQDDLFQAFAEEGIKAGLGQLMAADPRSPVQKYFSYAQKTASSRPPFKDHGVASALLLTKSWFDLDTYLDKLVASHGSGHAFPHGLAPGVAASQALDQLYPRIHDMQAKRQALRACVMRAAGAMSLHNITPGLWNTADAATQGLTFDTFRISIGKHRPEICNPLAFLLALVDTLQDWDRPTFSAKPNENALHSQDISIRPSKQAGKVLIFVRKDKEQFVEPATSKHSTYSRVVRILREFLDEDDVDLLVGWIAPDEPPERPGDQHPHADDPIDPPWELDFNAIMRMPATDPWRWTVVLSKDEASRHGDLMLSLRYGGQTGSRYIDSGFAYWGIGPTIQWRNTCQDRFYTVMRTGIETFRRRWNDLLKRNTTHLPDIYVSYGVGTGDKDHAILDTLKKRTSAPVYIPTDMSLDMLVNGAKTASSELLEPTRIIPLQIDFSSVTELGTIAEVRHNVLLNKPVLFSLVGNTLANFEDDLVILKLLTEMMNDDDLLLLEVAATRAANAETARLAASEYRTIPSFDSFVRSALTQHTDLPIDNEVQYSGEVCGDGQVLQVDMNYVSAERSTGRLIDGSQIVLQPGERVRLYRTRKYTNVAIQQLLRRAGLSQVASDGYWYRGDSQFGLYLGLCRRRSRSGTGG